MSRYTSKHTGPKIDEAVDRAKAGGEIDTLLNGKAPAGYGLGETSPYIAKTSESGEYDADTIDKTGFFAARTNTPTGNWCYGLHVNRTNNLAFQLLTSEFSEKEFALRKKISGVWQPWEWVNPPMKLGVEYRTTERYQGKPVYALCANFGANIDGSSMYFGENVLRIVRGQAYSGQGDGLYPWYQGKTINNWTAFFDFTVGTDTSDNIRKIKVTCRANSSASNTYSTTYVVLYYTKSTD